MENEDFNNVDGNEIGLTPEQIEDLEWQGDFENTEFEKRMDGYLKRKSRQQQKIAAQASNKKMGEIWQETLKEVGISQQEYNELFALDPKSGEELLKQGTKQLARGIAARKGKKPPQRNAPGHPAQQTQHQAQPKSNERVVEAQKTINKRPLSHEEELDILDTVLGSDFNL